MIGDGAHSNETSSGTQTAADLSGRGDNVAAPLLVWLLACVFMMAISARAIATRAFPDPDDIMRLLQVRDWIGGQSWFDVTQYRVNAPQGVAMHWSRLVDVPVAAVILVARLFVNQDRAETVALIAVPLVTLGITMLLVHRIALKLLTSRAALAAVAATPLSLGAMKQLRPMRIDHHGWQIVMALLGLLACFDERPRRSGIIAGAAMAAWLNISMEGMPFAAALGALFAFQWIRDRTARDRLEAYLAALALSTLVLFTGTHWPSTWMSQKHDVVTAAYVAGFVAASFSIAAIVRMPLKRWQERLAALAVAGAVTLATMFLVDAQWMSGPFSSLDPLVRTFWYEGVDEGLPMWKVHWSESAMGLAQPIVGLIGGWVALSNPDRDVRERWAKYVFLLAATAVSSVSVLRIATTASVLAMPGTAFLCQRAFRWARAQTMEVTRVFSTTGALLLMAPAYVLPVAVSSSNPQLDKALAAESECQKSAQVSRLQVLARGQFVAPFDLSPEILLNTNLDALATGHHRNVGGMHDNIEIFLDRPASSAAIIKRRNIDYVIICNRSPESIRYQRHAPDGLAAELMTSRVPNWLQPIQVPGLTAFKIWRVRKELLG